MKSNRGFTLIELVVSISLILLLFLIVVPTSTNLIQQSNKKHCETLIDELLTNAELYVIDNNIKSNTSIYFGELYNKGYIEDEYDFKNAFILDSTNADDSKNYILITRNVDLNDSNKGYNTYEITINGKTGKDDICK